MAFLDFNSSEGAPVHSIGTVVATPQRKWLRPRHQPAASRWQKLSAPALVALVVAAAPAALTGDYLDDSLLGTLSAVVLYAASAPLVASLFGQRQPINRAYHTKI
ncbi:hypothetical protein ACFB49_01510 [Sphingomonas sp. DBB INV C78]|uniref:hypothetical protein n=1 Tax=Sphingomonas sp. DBB INV C78 TaxID=3349434 RepID=UPI0036D40896